jgi:hypothetical protein
MKSRSESRTEKRTGIVCEAKHMEGGAVKGRTHSERISQGILDCAVAISSLPPPGITHHPDRHSPLFVMLAPTGFFECLVM